MLSRLMLIALVVWLASACNTNQTPSTGILEKAMRGEARIIDLGYSLNSATPYWPGGTYTPFKFETIATLEKDRVFSGKFEMPEHLGTHLDAPNHFATKQIPVDQIEPRDLIAPLVVLDVSAQVAANPDYTLTMNDLKQWETANGHVPAGAVVMLRTGWAKRYQDYPAYKNQDAAGVMHFPGYSVEAAQYLVQQHNIKGLGIDTLSVDPGISQDFAVHHAVHGAGRYHLENVANLEQLPPTGAIGLIAPIKIEGGSGGPARIFALLP